MQIKVIYLFTILIFAISFIACESNTEPKEGRIPSDVNAFPSAEMAAEVAFNSIMGIGTFIEESMSYTEIEESSGSGMMAQNDTSITYYDAETGWWHRSGYQTFGEDSAGINFEYDNKFQFFRNDSLIKWPVRVDAMHIIMDISSTFSFIYAGSSTVSTVLYDLDMMYTNLNTDIITINGSGHYDQKLDVQSNEGSQKLRYYLLYTFDELQVPQQGNPTGTITVETKTFKITIVFDGTDTARVTVRKDGNVVWQENRNMNEE